MTKQFILSLSLLYITAAMAQSSSSAQLYCPTKNTEALKYFEQGRRAKAQKNEIKALQLFALALENDPLFCDAADEVANFYKGLDNDKVIRYYMQAVKADSNDYTAAINLADILYNNDQYPGAIKIYLYAITIDSTDPRAYHGLAKIYIGQTADLNDYPQAYKYANKAVDLYQAKKLPIPLALRCTQATAEVVAAFVPGTEDVEKIKSRYLDYIYGLVYLQAPLNDKDKAKELLQKAESEGMILPEDVRQAIR